MPPYVVLRVCITLSLALKSIGIGLLYPLGVKDIFPGLYYVLCCSLIWHVSIGLLSVDTHLYCVFSGWRNQATNLVVILIVFELATLDCLDLLFALEFYIFSIWILPNYTKNIVLLSCLSLDNLFRHSKLLTSIPYSYITCICQISYNV